MEIEYATWGDPQNEDKVLLFPSMSNSCIATYHPSVDSLQASKSGGLWWKGVAGFGSNYGIDLNKHYLICITPLGSSWGSTSPLTINPDTHKPYGANFFQITPYDQAQMANMYIADHNIKLNTIIGGSMGGMQALCFGALFPDNYKKLGALATTGWTSPSTMALRHVQRECIKNDAKFNQGNYVRSHGGSGNDDSDSDNDNDNDKDDKNIDIGEHVMRGMEISRMIGMICYRARSEFDDRFKWGLKEKLNDDDSNFEVISYLKHHGKKFATNFDANCYLTMSRCMDRMNLGLNCTSFVSGVQRIPKEKECMILSYDTDYLMPSNEAQNVARILGNRKGSFVYYEELKGKYGHDSFLIDFDQINYRINAFLDNNTSGTGVDNVVKAVKELHH